MLFEYTSPGLYSTFMDWWSDKYAITIMYLVFLYVHMVFTGVIYCMFQLWFHNLTLRSAILQLEEPLITTTDSSKYCLIYLTEADIKPFL